VGSGSLQDFRIVEQVGRFLDVTVSLATLVFGGRMEQYPYLQFIGATAGGAISLLPSRLDMAYQPRHYAGKPGGPGDGATGRGGDGATGTRPEGPPGGPPGGGPPGGGPGGGPPGGPPGGGGPPAMMQYKNKITQPPSNYIRRIWVDTATFSGPGQVANLEMMGADHMLFGTDSPPLAVPLEATIETVNNLPISDEDKRKIFSENAKRLFKLNG
jgi:aminocarboxymuconate-semialdehyde decarboxylase